MTQPPLPPRVPPVPEAPGPSLDDLLPAHARPGRPGALRWWALSVGVLLVVLVAVGWSLWSLTVVPGRGGPVAAPPVVPSGPATTSTPSATPTPTATTTTTTPSPTTTTTTTSRPTTTAPPPPASATPTTATPSATPTPAGTTVLLRLEVTAQDGGGTVDYGTNADADVDDEKVSLPWSAQARVPADTGYVYVLGNSRGDGLLTCRVYVGDVLVSESTERGICITSTDVRDATRS